MKKRLQEPRVIVLKNGESIKLTEREYLESFFVQRDESAERAIIGTITEALYEGDKKLIEELLKYAPDASAFSVFPEYRELFKKLLEFFQEEEEWNIFTFKNWIERKEKERFKEFLSWYDDLIEEAVGLETYKATCKIVKEKAAKADAIIKIFESAKADTPEFLKTIEEIKKQIEEKMAEDEEDEIEKILLEDAITIEDLENTVVEYLVDGFIPRQTVVGITAHAGTGKSTLIYALLKTYILPKGIRVFYVDLDNPWGVIKDRLIKSGLIEYLGKQLIIWSRHKSGINASSESWKRKKNALLKLDEHCVIIIDSLKNFAKGNDINSDKEAEFIMSELKDLTAKHTVIYLHHVKKDYKENSDTPAFKNSGTILDNTDVAYVLSVNKQTRISKLRMYKDRVPVKEVHEFYLEPDYTLSKPLPEWIREAIKFVKAVYEEIEKGNNKKTKLAKAVAEKTKMGINRCETLLEKYAGNFWEIKKGEYNAKIVEIIKDLDKAIEELERKAYAQPVENQEFHNSENSMKQETVENQEFHSFITHIYKESNYETESNTLKFGEEVKAIQKTLKELLEYSDYVDLGTIQVYDAHEENAKEIAQDPTLKSILLELYIAHDRGSVESWESLIERVKNREATFAEGLRVYEDLKDVDF